MMRGLGAAPMPLLGTAVVVGKWLSQHTPLRVSAWVGWARSAVGVAEASTPAEAQTEEASLTAIVRLARVAVPRVVPFAEKAVRLTSGWPAHRTQGSAGRSAPAALTRAAPELLDEPALAFGRARVTRPGVEASIARAGVTPGVELARVRPSVETTVDVETFARAEAPVSETELGTRPAARAGARAHVAGIASGRRRVRAGGKQEDEHGSHGSSQRAHAPARSQVRVAGRRP